MPTIDIEKLSIAKISNVSFDESKVNSAHGDSSAALNRTLMQLINRLNLHIQEPGTDWRRAVIETVGKWQLTEKNMQGDEVKYLVAGEAFDWKRLALRVCGEIPQTLPLDQAIEWLMTPDPCGGIPPQDMMRLIGSERYRAHLNYYYGVIVERTLQVAVEIELMKRLEHSVGIACENGLTDAVFINLYDDKEAHLLSLFKGNDDDCNGGVVSIPIVEYDEFTYWLFKRRLAISDKARLASDTKKGIDQLERMYIYYQRREKITSHHNNAGTHYEDRIIQIQPHAQCH